MVGVEGKQQPVRDSTGQAVSPMTSETAKLPKGQSYPLKPMKLAEALASEGVVIEVHLKRSPGVTFDAYFWPPNHNRSHELLYIRVGTVPADQAADARLKMETATLPALVKWITGILAKDPRSPIRRAEQWIDLTPH